MLMAGGRCDWLWLSFSPCRHFAPSAAPASLQPAETLSPALVPPTHHVFPSAVVPIIHLPSTVLHISISLSLSFCLPPPLSLALSHFIRSAARVLRVHTSQHTQMSNEGEIGVMNSGQSSVCVLQLCVFLFVAVLLCRIYVNLTKTFFCLSHALRPSLLKSRTASSWGDYRDIDFEKTWPCAKCVAN